MAQQGKVFAAKPGVKGSTRVGKELILKSYLFYDSHTINKYSKCFKKFNFP